MRNKRNAFNDGIYQQISVIETDYSDRIADILRKILEEITDDADKSILFCSDINNLYSLQSQNLSESELDMYSISSCLLVYCLFKHNNKYGYCQHFHYVLSNRVNVWKHISQLYQEGVDKINELTKQIIPPKKILRVDNFETVEEYNKMCSYCIDKYCEGEMKKEYLNELLDSMKCRAISLGLVTIGDFKSGKKVE